MEKKILSTVKNTKNNGSLYFHLFAEKKNKIHGEVMTECNTE